MKISFVCEKDPVLAQYYDNRFREEFEVALPLFPQMTDVERLGVQAGWKLAMLAEARRQQHYDFTVEGDGLLIPHRRVPRIGIDGKKALLIPDIDLDLTPAL